MTLVDSHCHVDGADFEADRDDVIRRAQESGVAAMLNVGTGDPNSGSFERAIEIANKYESVFASVGVHPHDAKLYNTVAEEKLISLAEESRKCVAWGEIGLDFHYDNSPRDVQREVFRKQIRVAHKLKLPIIVHSRSADHETVAILRDECTKKDFRGGVMHCFGGTPKMAEEVLTLGFYVSFAGNVTFKKADLIRESAGVVPLDRMLVETDCPFLTPTPFRGKRNEPMYVVETAQFVADFLGVDFDEFAGQTTSNFKRLFGVDFA